MNKTIEKLLSRMFSKKPMSQDRVKKFELSTQRFAKQFGQTMKKLSQE